MKLRVEISNDAPDEVVIHCKRINDDIKLLQDIVSNVIDKNAELVLHINNNEYYVPRNDILFFETVDNKVCAHSADKMYYTDYKLYELEKMLPRNFVRASKSSILNCSQVSSINKNITGASEIFFKSSHKKVYVSRMYFKIFHERMNETRLLK